MPHKAVPFKQRAVGTAQRLVTAAGFELTRDRFRHRFVYALDQHDVGLVLDVGANVGQFGVALRRAGYVGDIVSLEPLAAPYDALQRCAATDPRWRHERAAVSDTVGTISMNVSANSVSSSVLPILATSTDAAPATRYVATEDVPATTVDDLVSRHGIVPETSLLKIDVQGFEMAVLQGAAETLTRFAALRLELSLTPLYEGQVLMPAMLDHLAQHGFELWYVEPGWVDPQTRRLLQLDGAFFRTGR